jgi:hypothetical protein
MDEFDLNAKTDRELLLLVAQRTNDLCGRVDAQNGRVRKLEDWRNYLAGAIAVLTFLVLLIGGWLLGRV